MISNVIKQKDVAKSPKSMKGSFRYSMSSLLVCIFLLFLTLFPSPAISKSHKEILILNSYHPGYVWSDNIVSGVQSEMAEYPNEYDLYIEYMDTQRHFDDSYLRILYETYKHKYKNVGFDVIISGDDNALNFLIKYRDDLFPGVPIVFCGVNRFSKSLIKDVHAITGVIEKIDIKATIDLILKIQPRTQEIAVIHDQSSSALGNYEQFQKISSQYEGRVKFIEITNVTFLELQQILKNLPENTALLYLLFLTDREGTVLSKEKILELISEGSNRPIYSCWGQEVNIGVTGGVVVSGVTQGQFAIKMAKRILSGEKAKDIPVLLESPNVVMFDNSKLEQFGIDSSLLPEESIVLNKPVAFYGKYKIYIWLGLTIIFVLSSCVVLLYLNIQKRKEVEEKFRLLLEHHGEGVYGLDMNGICTFANPSCVKILGYKSVDEFLGKNMHDLIHYKRADGSVYPNEDCRIYKSFRQGKGTHVADEVLWKADGTSFPAEYWSFPIFKKAVVVGSVVGFNNIEERKRIEEEREALINNLQKALDEIKTLRGILPLCSYCKKIRDDSGYWEQVDVYIHKHSEADISHSICQDCMKQYHPEEYESIYSKKE